VICLSWSLLLERRVHLLPHFSPILSGEKLGEG
jgi:hypothetical protein